MREKPLTFGFPPALLIVMLLFLVAPSVTSGIFQLQHFPVDTVVVNLTWLWVFAFIQVALYWWLMIVVVGQDGLNLYRLRTLNWSNIREAQIRTTMGLDYLYIKRRKGMPHWVPLCFKGEGPDLLEAIQNAAPADNPVQEIKRSPG